MSSFKDLFSLEIMPCQNTNHAFSIFHILRPVFILPAEERSQGDDDGHHPDEGDQHPDGSGVSGVNVVRVSDCPVPAVISE